MDSATTQQDLMRKALFELRELRAKLEAKENAEHEPIAIVGMGCRFPGANSPEAFWSLLHEGRDAVGEVPPSRWDGDRIYDPNPDAAGKIYTTRGAFLSDVEHFDAAFFGISPKEAASLDPKQRILLELAWETLERANLSPDSLFGQPVGVFIGIGGFDFPTRVLAERGEAVDAYFASGSSLCVAAGRISYQLGLTGPSLAVDTACSASLVTVHLAVQSLRRRECDLALAGGANLMLTPEISINFCRARMLAADGCCKAFDAAADGYVRGEGVGLVALKRLSDALADGDRIEALILGSAVNQDGASGGLTVPNGPAQTRVVQTALADARVKPEQVSYIEAHGTGTSLGDPIELGALAKVFGKGERWIRVGTVKTNIGHLESAAGIAGLIKTALALKQGEIPPNLHFRTPNPKIPWRSLPFEVPKHPIAWTEKERYAGVSAFAFMGTNAHVILANAPEKKPVNEAKARPQAGRPLHFLALSAKSESSLRRLAARFRDFVEATPTLLPTDLCLTANTRRVHHPLRLTLVGDSMTELAERLRLFAQEEDEGGRPSAPLNQGRLGFSESNLGRPQGHKPRIAFLFTGQGAQVSGMGQELYNTSALFRTAMDRCAEILEPLLERPLIEVLYGSDPSTRALIDQTAYTQPALFALGYALTELWKSWGVRPEAVMGHSMGEYLAACVAGVFSLEDGLRLVAARARLMQSLPNGGGMLSVRANEAAVRGKLGRARRVSLAAHNGPESFVLAGPIDELEILRSAYGVEGIEARMLRVSHAFHSVLMDPILQPFARIASTIKSYEPRLPLISNLTGDQLGNEAPTADYWVRQLREPVAFAKGIAKLRELGIDSLVELGPQPHLLALGRACWETPGEHAAEVLWLPSLRSKPWQNSASSASSATAAGNDMPPAPAPDRQGQDWHTLLLSLSELYRRGQAIDWEGFERESTGSRIELPTYPFDRQFFPLPLPRISAPLSTESNEMDPNSERAELNPAHAKQGAELEGEASGESPEADGLGSALEQPDGSLRFEFEIDTDMPAYLGDHRLFGQVIVPASFLAELVLSAGRKLNPSAWLEELRIERPLILHTALNLQLDLDPELSGCRECRISLSNSSDETEQSEQLRPSVIARARIRLECQSVELMPTEPPDELRERLTAALDPAQQLAKFRALGLDYGPAFRGIVSLFQGPGESLALIQSPACRPDEGPWQRHCLHPALLDACFQTVFAAFPNQDPGLDSDAVYLPVAIHGLVPHGEASEQVWCHARLLEMPDRERPWIEAQLHLFSADGTLLARIERLIGQKSSSKALKQTLQPPPFLYREAWIPLSGQESVATGELRNQADNHDGSGRWLLFRDMLGIGSELARRFTLDHKPHFLIDPNGSLPAPEDESAWDLTIRSLHPLNGVIFTSELISSGLEVEGALTRLSAFVKALLRDKLEWPPMLCFVTLGACAVGDKSPCEPGQAAIWSFARSLALEHPEFGIRMVDLDPAEHPKEAIGQILNLMERPEHTRIAWRNELAYSAQLQRLYLGSGSQPPRLPSGWQVDEPPGAPTQPAFQLVTHKPGMFENLTLRQVSRRIPAVGEVEIEVKAAGLNFRDVLRALGMLEVKQVLGREVGVDLPFGIECAGVISTAGIGTAFRPGQSVVAVFAAGAMGTHVTLPAQFVAPMPERFSFEGAATLPLAALTAYYGLRHLARLQAGERVLIHAAAGGVGLAALQIARACGAEIHASASPAKWPLLRELGVTHLYNSRSPDFAEVVKSLCGERGIDVVLNSLNGEFIERSLELCASGARFIEIGKLGIWSARQMREARSDVAYYPFDLGEVAAAQPELVARLMRETMELWSRPGFDALPHREFPLSEAETAFRTMAQGKHVGKLLLIPPGPEHLLALDPKLTAVPMQPSEERAKPHTTGSLLPVAAAGKESASLWLISGGLGALGLELAAHLARPERELLLVSRNQPQADAADRIEKLRARGFTLRTAQCDVSDPKALGALLDSLKSERVELRAIVHVAGVLDDGPVRELTPQRLASVLAPKCRGAWNLHELSRRLPIEHFILFSSAAAVLGSPGQCAYAAANGFLDALARQRRAAGLPAQTIAWGAWAGQGMASNAESIRTLRSRGMRPLHPETALALFDLILQSGQDWVGAFDIDWPRYAQRLHPGPAPVQIEALLREASAKRRTQSSGSAAKAQAKAGGPTTARKGWDWLGRAEAEERSRLLRRELQRLAGKVLGHAAASSVPLDRPLMDLGFDSLLAVEFRNHLGAASGLTLPASLLFDYPTLDKIAGYLLERLAPKAPPLPAPTLRPTSAHTSPTSSSQSKTDQSTEDLLAELDSLLGD